MPQKPAVWFRSVAIGAVLVALVMTVAMEGLQSIHLPLWLHIPLTALVLGLLSAGALAAGIAWVEFQARSSGNGEEAK